MSDYPEHDKLHLVKDATQAAGEFVEWLGTQGIFLAVREQEWDRAVPASCSITDLLARWHDIDLSKIEAEKRAMLATIRADAEVPER